MCAPSCIAVAVMWTVSFTAVAVTLPVICETVEVMKPLGWWRLLWRTTVGVAPDGKASGAKA